MGHSPLEQELDLAVPSQNPDFSLLRELKQGMLNEKMFAKLDLGPTEYDFFYGNSPLTSASSSSPSTTSPSRSASPPRRCSTALSPSTQKPKDSDWDSVSRGALLAIQKSAKRCRFPKKAQNHRRGDFPALGVGISFGVGQKKAGNLRHSRTNEAELQTLLGNNYIKRISGLCNAAFATWSPKLFNFYLDNLNELLDSDPSLIRNFNNSVWAATTFNYGPRTVTRRHLDYANLPFGWCGITALGDFDHTKGGHMILWNLKLAIEFPAGSSMLIASAAITHSNTPISRRETRCSFTQYTTGGVFRWVAYKCQKAQDYFDLLDDKGLEQEMARQEERCRLGLSLFWTVDEIRRRISSET